MTIRDQGIEHITQIKLRICETDLASLQAQVRRSADRLMGTAPDLGIPVGQSRAFLACLARRIEETERQISEHRSTLDSLKATKTT